MHIRVGTDINWNDGMDSFASLPLHQTTNVRLEAAGSYIVLYLNNTVDNYMTLGGVRSSGQATLYASNRWNSPASAKIGSIQMTPISSIDYLEVKASKEAKALNGQLSLAAAYEETTVPVNYSLSFDITPSGTTTSVWSSIIHYTSNLPTSKKPDLGRMPGIFCIKSY